MNLPTSHIEQITALGYTEAEARFLYIVATHSGYFTMRQFLAFAGTHWGKRTTTFTLKLLKRAHATIRDYMGAGSIFHLFSRTIYKPIEKDNFRNRRRHSFDYIRTRLVLLDFILENPEYDFFETEQDKVRFFCDELGVPKEVLPAKVYEGFSEGHPTIRFFVDKFPLFLAPPFPSLPPVVTFTYVDPGCASLANFTSHLGAYQALFRQLQSFRFLYIATRMTQLGRAEACFRNSIKRPLEGDVSSDILRYFEIRRKWESRKYIIPVTEDFEFLAEARRRFKGERFEDLYRDWYAQRLDERQLRIEFAKLIPNRTVFFDTYLVGNHRSPLDEKLKTTVNGA
jgi:hypothetical protein